MSSQTYKFFNNTSTLSITLSPDDSSLAQKVFTYTSSSPIYRQWVGGSNEVNWTALTNAASNGSTIIGLYSNPLGSIEYCFLDSLTYGSSGSAVFSRKYNDPEADTITYYFNVYDAGSSSWQTEWSINTNYNNAKTTGWYGTSNTGATTQAKVVTCSNYTLNTGNIISVTFSTANTYTSAKITLNVNSTGAKDIYYNGSVTSSSNQLTWDAGEQITFIYSGSYYYFVSRNKSSSPATVTLAQLQTGTDTTGYLISPKVLADYIASLDASNVSY